MTAVIMMNNIFARDMTEENLIIAKKSSIYLKKIISDCLKIKEDEKLVIIGDHGYENRRISKIISAGYCIAAEELGIKDIDVVLQEPKSRGDEAEEQVMSSLESLESGSVIILAISNRLGKISHIGKSFRSFVKDKGHRFASMPSLGNIPTENIDNILSTFDIDYNQVRENCSRIRNIIDKGKELHITNDKGTDLHMNIRGKKALSVDGKYDREGKGGNVPIGEVYTPCRGKFVEGRVVIDLSSRIRESTQIVKEPITLDIKKGAITSITGGTEARTLENTLEWAHKNSEFPWGVRRIGELGIGLNPRAKIIGSMNIDEKVVGTAHIAIGSNHWFGGTIYSITHLDQVFSNPTIKVDGELLDLGQAKFN
ncbi:MAG: aminopeptidase [Candidatus Aenigmarchaeota archaeon]|nr:aminopeptidase [Candidatus Aenigmarchaeota archaeon]